MKGISIESCHSKSPNGGLVFRVVFYKDETPVGTMSKVVSADFLNKHKVSEPYFTDESGLWAMVRSLMKGGSGHYYISEKGMESGKARCMMRFDETWYDMSVTRNRGRALWRKLQDMGFEVLSSTAVETA